MASLDSHLDLKRCPHCRVDNPNLVQVTKFGTHDYNTTNYRFWGIYKCNRCGGVVTAASWQENQSVTETYPSEIEVDENIPKKAKAFLNQAIDSLNAPSGAIMLAASSIDAMLKEKGYKDGKLYGRINKAATDHLITSEMAKWAHEVRLDANDERHADDDAELPDMQDARKTVNFALALAEYLFILPSKIQRGIDDASNNSTTST